eukprot:1155948-Pelagomonas_calceolata.AAC.7
MKEPTPACCLPLVSSMRKSPPASTSHWPSSAEVKRQACKALPHEPLAYRPCLGIHLLTGPA